jgi:putative Ca2+/H+ antiporter (TMEM165/GDT1 family)
LCAAPVQDERSTVGLSLHQNPKAKRRYRLADAFLGMSVAFLVSICLVTAHVSRLVDWLLALLGITFLAFAVRDWIERHQREEDEGRYLKRPD